MSNSPEKLVFRQIAFPVSTFDWLKDCQRSYAAQHGHFLNNNEILAVILREHRTQTEECGAHRNVISHSQTGTYKSD